MTAQTFRLLLPALFAAILGISCLILGMESLGHLNSDLLYLPALFEETLGGWPLRGRSLTPNPYLFPDMVLYGVAYGVSEGWRAAFSTYVVLWSAVWAGAWWGWLVWGGGCPGAGVWFGASRLGVC